MPCAWEAKLKFPTKSLKLKTNKEIKIEIITKKVPSTTLNNLQSKFSPHKDN